MVYFSILNKLQINPSAIFSEFINGMCPKTAKPFNKNGPPASHMRALNGQHFISG